MLWKMTGLTILATIAMPVIGHANCGGRAVSQPQREQCRGVVSVRCNGQTLQIGRGETACCPYTGPVLWWCDGDDQSGVKCLEGATAFQATGRGNRMVFRCLAPRVVQPDPPQPRPPIVQPGPPRNVPARARTDHSGADPAPAE